MKPKGKIRSLRGFNPANTKSFRLYPNVFYAGILLRRATADLISKQLLSLFINFYPGVKH